jgi:hypothetical protein
MNQSYEKMETEITRMNTKGGWLITLNIRKKVLLKFVPRMDNPETVYGSGKSATYGGNG